MSGIKEERKCQKTKHQTPGPSTGKLHANTKVKTDDDMPHIMDFPTLDSTLSSDKLPSIIDISSEEVPKKQGPSGTDDSVDMGVLFDDYHVPSPPDVIIPGIDYRESPRKSAKWNISPMKYKKPSPKKSPRKVRKKKEKRR